MVGSKGLGGSGVKGQWPSWGQVCGLGGLGGSRFCRTRGGRQWSRLGAEAVRVS